VGADSRPKGAKRFSAPPFQLSAPPAEIGSAPGAEYRTGGAESFIFTRDLGGGMGR